MPSGQRTDLHRPRSSPTRTSVVCNGKGGIMDRDLLRQAAQLLEWAIAPGAHSDKLESEALRVARRLRAAAEQRCGTCQHWDENRYEPADHGTCELIGDADEEAPAHTIGDYAGWHALETQGCCFGCVQWEGKA